MVGEEDTHQFACASVATQANADVGEHHFAAKVSQNPGGAAVLFMYGVLIRDGPDILAEVLHITELNMGCILHIYFHHTIQQRGLIAIKSRVVLLYVAHAALLIGDNECMRKRD